MIQLDGSFGEGGGQILRSALGLAAVTGQAFAIHSIRAGRRKPGLMRQHLTAVQAAALVSGAEVTGAELGSRALTFVPGPVVPGRYRFAIGTAGSTTLVLQTVLPPLMLAGGPSQLEITGGTHNPWCPPCDFLTGSFLPLLRRCGPDVGVVLRCAGFHPAGGGRIDVKVVPSAELAPFELLERGALRSRRAVARVANLPASIARRELDVVRKELGFDAGELVAQELSGGRGPGNVLTVEHEFEHVTHVSTGFGQRGVPAEQVARAAVADTRRLLASDVPVGEYLADQLVLSLALAGRGAFRTGPPSQHTRTNAEVIGAFLPVRFSFVEETEDRWRIDVRGLG